MAIYLQGNVWVITLITQLPYYKVIRCLGRNVATPMQSTHQDGKFELLEKTIGELIMAIWAIGKNDRMMIHDDSLLHGGLIGVITLITQLRGNKYLGRNVLPCYAIYSPRRSIWAIGKNDWMMIHDDSLLHGGLIGVITLITKLGGN